jgi:cytochrome P450
VSTSSNVPAALVCQIMGVPPGDWPYMRELVDRLVGRPDPEFQKEGPPDAAVQEMLQYFAGLVQERRRHPARLETKVMLEEIARGLPGLELAGEVEGMYAVVVSVIKHMPVRFSPVP